jgi:DNA-binding NarL/FixJ family response regulator
MGGNGNGSESPIHVCVQQRLRLFRIGLAELLGNEPDIAVVGIAVTGAQAAEVVALAATDVLVVDLESDGVEACRTAALVRSVAPHIRFVALSGPDGPDASSLVPAALATFPVRVRRSDGVRAVLDAVREAPYRQLGGVVLPEETTRDPLSSRELDVLALVGAGCTTREISERLAISRKTVENHKQHIFSKLQVRNQAHAVAVALRAGMISVDGVIDLREAP